MGTFVGKRVTARGFIVWDFNAKYGPALRQMGEWVRSGRIKFKEDIVEGSTRRRAPSSASCAARTSASCRSSSGPTPRRVERRTQHPARWRSAWAVVLTWLGALGNLVTSSL